jgi:hypothetical protein
MIQAMKRVRSFKEQTTHLHVCQSNPETMGITHLHHYLLLMSYRVDKESGLCIPDVTDPLTSLILSHHDEVNDKRQLLNIMENIWVNHLGNSWLIIHDEVVNNDKEIITELNELFGYTSNKFKSPLSKKNLPRTLDKIITKILFHFNLTNSHRECVIWISSDQLCTEYEIRLFFLLISIYSLFKPKFNLHIDKSQKQEIKVSQCLTIVKKIQKDKGDQLILTKGKKRLRNNIYEYEYFLDSL